MASAEGARPFRTQPARDLRAHRDDSAELRHRDPDLLGRPMIAGPGGDSDAGLRSTDPGKGASLALWRLAWRVGGCAVGALEVLMHEGDRHAALADGGGDPFDRREAHVAAREDARDARL